MEKSLYLVKLGNACFITYTYNRESAKRDARSWLGGYSDQYTVTPITEKGDRLHLHLTMFV